MAAIGKLTIKRTDLIKKVRANREAAKADHEARYGKPQSDAEVRKLLTKYRDDLAKWYYDVATAMRKLTDAEALSDLTDGQALRYIGISIEEPKRPKIVRREFTHDGYDEVIELLELAQDDTITLSGVQYESYLRGRIDHRQHRRY